MMSRRALIFSSSADIPNFEGVSGRLRQAGFEVIELLSDEVLAGRQKLQLEVHEGSRLLGIDGHSPFDPKEVQAAWWRKPQWTQVVRQDAGQRLSLELELERMHLAIASLVPETAWLNSPGAMRAAESKLRQLDVAAELGFKCPQTLVTNDWEKARSGFGSKKVVFKALRGGIRREGEDRVVFTQRVDLNAAISASGTLPYPGLLQAEIERLKEWRVTVVGTSVFPVAVYASRDGVDWRRDQLQGQTRFASEKLDPMIEEACLALVGRLGLRYAAIDFIQEPSGGYVFLEANSNGQYAWLEEQLGLPISAEIARTLENPTSISDAAGR